MHRFAQSIASLRAPTAQVVKIFSGPGVSKPAFLLGRIRLFETQYWAFCKFPSEFEVLSLNDALSEAMPLAQSRDARRPTDALI